MNDGTTQRWNLARRLRNQYWPYHRVRILRICPVRSWSGAEGPFEMPWQRGVGASTRVDEIYCAEGPRSVEPDTMDLAAPMVVEKARWGATQGYDALFVCCMAEPGLAAARQEVDIPVVGPREACLLEATRRGLRPGFIYPSGIAVRDLRRDLDQTIAALIEEGRRAIHAGAELLVPECTLLAGIASRLENELGIPVLENEPEGLRLAERLALAQPVRPQWHGQNRYGRFLRRALRRESSSR